MPELPEVEVTKRGVSKALLNHKIVEVYVGDKKLRVPMTPELKLLEGASVQKLERRGKYIIVFTDKGSLIIHLGMTGHLQIIESNTEMALHDHFEMKLDSGLSVRYNDTRRFGLLVYIAPGEDPYAYPMIASLGPEPLEDSFTPEVLLERLKSRKSSLKQALMDSKIVVGVGNIYASETLFLSKISPERKANSLSKEEASLLVKNIKEVLAASIESGGTTIRDFEGADGKPGYFVQKLNVYGHEGEPCKVCGTPITRIVQGQRATYFCSKCQH